MPLFPELQSYLKVAFELASPGAEEVISHVTQIERQPAHPTTADPAQSGGRTMTAAIPESARHA